MWHSQSATFALIHNCQLVPIQIYCSRCRELGKLSDDFPLGVYHATSTFISAERTTESKEDDPLSTAAAHFKIDTKALRASITKEEQEKARKKAKQTAAKAKPKPTGTLARK